MNNALYYEQHIFCCINERPDGHKNGCCASKEGVKLKNYMKAKVKELNIKSIRINNSGCLDRCKEGPIMVIYPEGTWYTYKTTEDIDEIIEKHIQNNEIVERLLVPCDI